MSSLCLPATRSWRIFGKRPCKPGRQINPGSWWNSLHWWLSFTTGSPENTSMSESLKLSTLFQYCLWWGHVCPDEVHDFIFPGRFVETVPITKHPPHPQNPGLIFPGLMKIGSDWRGSWHFQTWIGATCQGATSSRPVSLPASAALLGGGAFWCGISLVSRTHSREARIGAKGSSTWAQAVSTHDRVKGGSCPALWLLQVSVGICEFPAI